jgi:hypothetical protein
MIPTLTPFYVGYGRPINTKFLCDYFSWSIVHSYLNRQFFGEFCPMMSGPVNTFKKWESVFFDTILSIIFFSTNKKVMGVYARWGVAFMEYTHIFWNWTIVYFPRRSVCSPRMFVGYGKRPIPPTAISGTRPQPTSAIWFSRYETFKSFLKGYPRSGILVIRHLSLLAVHLFRPWEKLSLLSWPSLILSQHYNINNLNSWGGVLSILEQA